MQCFETAIPLCPPAPEFTLSASLKHIVSPSLFYICTALIQTLSFSQAE